MIDKVCSACCGVFLQKQQKEEKCGDKTEISAYKLPINGKLMTRVIQQQKDSVCRGENVVYDAKKPSTDGNLTDCRGLFRVNFDVFRPTLTGFSAYLSENWGVFSTVFVQSLCEFLRVFPTSLIRLIRNMQRYMQELSSKSRTSFGWFLTVFSVSFYCFFVVSNSVFQCFSQLLGAFQRCSGVFRTNLRYL